MIVDFQVKFDRKYSAEEEEERKFNFLKTLQFIESHNKLYERGNVSHEVGINQFADWVSILQNLSSNLKLILKINQTSDEYNSLLSGKPDPLNLSDISNITESPEPTFYAALPASFDWRTSNKVTPVKDQGIFKINFNHGF